MSRRDKRSGGKRRRKRPVRRRQAPVRTALSGILLVGAAVFAAAHLDLLRRSWTWLVSSKPAHSTKLTMEQARAANAAIPFAADRPVPAQPFIFHGGLAAREQAAECLATAALYEAGDDPRGQRAVMQVVLNRVRRPAFPKTICGVVYQGAARATGCQFSFTCDGSVERRPQRAGWAAARKAARRALAGYVFRPIGTATYYHTDWILPGWIGSLDKIAKIHTHIFYRERQTTRAS